jgi:peroxisomal coenzyme A diphosphatase NUDT7
VEIKKIIQSLEKHAPSILGSRDYSKFAVLLPLIEKEDGIHILFEVRSLQLRNQPGDICFPGGRMDPQDMDEAEAAIRETIEELGILKEDISSVFPLDYLMTPFGMFVYPFAGLIHNLNNLNLNSDEVSGIFTVPLSYFMNTKPDIHYVHFKAEPSEDFPYHLLVGGQNYNWRRKKADEYFYVYEGKVIWGMTARIIAHFIELIR